MPTKKNKLKKKCYKKIAFLFVQAVYNSVWTKYLNLKINLNHLVNTSRLR